MGQPGRISLGQAVTPRGLAARPGYDCMTKQDRTGQDRTGQDRTGQDRTGQDRTGQDRTGQDRTCTVEEKKIACVSVDCCDKNAHCWG